jgi:hypothetical protein
LATLRSLLLGDPAAPVKREVSGTGWLPPLLRQPRPESALREAKGTPPAPAWEKLKKAELAALAERETSGTGWLPALLR